MNILAFILKLVSLVPIIANGVHVVQNDLSPTGLNSKLAAAQDALSLASEGSIALLPAADQPLATAVASAASTGLASTVVALHNAAQPNRGIDGEGTGSRVQPGEREPFAAEGFQLRRLRSGYSGLRSIFPSTSSADSTRRSWTSSMTT